jgi:putative transposase
MRKMMKYRLYPATAQTLALEEQLHEACRLYNAALHERREAYQRGGLSLNYYDQANQLKAIRDAGACGLANFSASQDVLGRVDKTFKAFFRRVKAGVEHPGYPRFKSRRRFDSYTFPSWGDGCRLTDAGRLYLQGVRHLRVQWHRPLEGHIKTVTVKRQAGKWLDGRCSSVNWPTKRQKLVGSWCTLTLAARAKPVSVAHPYPKH